MVVDSDADEDAYSSGPLDARSSVRYLDVTGAGRSSHMEELEIRRRLERYKFYHTPGNEMVDRYWHGTHEGSSRFAGDGKAARASGVLTWNPEPGPDPSKSRD